MPGANPFCTWKGLEVFCGPRGYPGGHNLLYHNESGRSFTDVTQKAGMELSDLHYNLGVVSSDFDDDGWPDIYVACDSTPSLLYRNNHNGTFTEIAVARGVAYGPDGQEQGSMGVAAGDYDNDGRIDIVKTNFIQRDIHALPQRRGRLFRRPNLYGRPRRQQPVRRLGRELS